ncbi:neprilysin-1-like isoform X2 [Brevipalpus obovatus]|uniref:neprilysin-1-like isoform X2 n=1 Tax=Brevipalpus obovatus TaxID=246614 RepID=UPI003D9F489A
MIQETDVNFVTVGIGDNQVDCKQHNTKNSSEPDKIIQTIQSVVHQSSGLPNGSACGQTDNFPRTPSIHISENPMSGSFTSWSMEDKASSFPANLASPASELDEERIPSPVIITEEGAIGGGGQASPSQPYQYYRINRLLSVGPEFHLQIKHPSSIELLHWKTRTDTEKRLILLVCILLILTPLLIFITYNLKNHDKLDKNQDVCLTPECVKIASSLLDAMDTRAEPCEDFFQFACGSWNRKHQIPEDKARISTFEVLGEDLQRILRGLLEEPASGHDNSATIKAKTFYKSCMNLDKIEEIGDEQLKKVIESLGGWPAANKSWDRSDFGLERNLARVRRDFSIGILIEIMVSTDDRNSSLNIIQIDQMSLGLNSKDYYLKPSSKKDLEAYHKFMVDVAVLMGGDPNSSSEELRKVIDFETSIANASLHEQDRQDTGSLYEKIEIRQLSEIFPQFDWLVYFNSLLPVDVESSELIVIYCEKYLRQVQQTFVKSDPKVIQNYLVWRVIFLLLPYVGGDFKTKRAEFRKVTTGITAEQLRWSLCVEMVNKRLGTAVGSLFIRDHFDPESKKTALKMIHKIREAFNELLEQNEWMDEETKRVAKEKADAMNERIGYSDSLTNHVEVSKEYEELQVYEEQFLHNVINFLRFDSKKNFEKLRKPVDKDKWSTEPAVVNAFYNPNKNDIVFPAGIFQPQFYGSHYPKSLNYGGIGVVIGHEITHGFDAKGRQFDKEGNMKIWWNNVTIERFRERTQCIIDQYSSYVLNDINLNVNGKLTQGENIADNGGLKQSYRAFKKWEAENGPESLLPGLNLNHDQLFFLNYAQIWCGSMRPQEALNKVRTAVHSPGPIRVLGPLSNSYDFARVYNCPLGSRMNPRKKCSIW